MIIGFTGKAGSGKTTTARILMDQAMITGMVHDVYKLSFAEPLKRIAREQFGWDGNKDERGRRLLQVLGTEAGRAYNENIWVQAFMRLVDQHEAGNSGGILICVDDVRFDNEAQAIRDRGGYVFRVEGRAEGLGANTAHASERGVSDGLITGIVNNQGDLDVLRGVVTALLEHWVRPVVLEPDASFIQTHTGVAFDFGDPRPQSIRIKDIAHALSHICRFGGHTKDFYSVADHCCNVAAVLAAKRANPQTVLWGLLHDAAEAYIGDIVTPLKALLPEASRLEERLQEMIRRKFSIRKDLIDFAAVKQADRVMLVSEAGQLFDREPLNGWTGRMNAQPLRSEIYVSSCASAAERLYLQIARQLFFLCGCGVRCMGAALFPYQQEA